MRFSAAILLVLISFSLSAQTGRLRVLDYEISTGTTQYKAIIKQAINYNDTTYTFNIVWPKGIFVNAISSIPLQEFFEMVRTIDEIKFQAPVDEKSEMYVQNTFVCQSGLILGYYCRNKRVQWFISQELIGEDEIVKLERDKLLTTLSNARNFMLELTK